LPTSEKAGNLIAKRPEPEFSIGAATVCCSVPKLPLGIRPDSDCNGFVTDIG
jgi:hypothetical protein